MMLNTFRKILKDFEDSLIEVVSQLIDAVVNPKFNPN